MYTILSTRLKQILRGATKKRVGVSINEILNKILIDASVSEYGVANRNKYIEDAILGKMRRDNIRVRIDVPISSWCDLSDLEVAKLIYENTISVYRPCKVKGKVYAKRHRRYNACVRS